MTILRASFPSGSIDTEYNRQLIARSDLVIAAFTEGTRVRLCRSRMKPGGLRLVANGYELGMVKPEARVTSAAFRIYADARNRGLIAPVTKDGRVLLRLDDAPMLDAHLRAIGPILAAAPDSRECDLIHIDAAVWSYPERVALGAPNDLEEFKAWCKQRMAAFWYRAPGKPISINSWGDSIWAADTLNPVDVLLAAKVRKFESGPTWGGASKYGTTIGKILPRYVSNMLASARKGVDVVHHWIPLPLSQWTEDQVESHMEAGALLHLWLRYQAAMNRYTGRIYWSAGDYEDGTHFDECLMPACEVWLVNPVESVTAASNNPSDVWLTVGGSTWRVVLPESGSHREPLMIRAVPQ